MTSLPPRSIMATTPITYAVRGAAALSVADYTLNAMKYMRFSFHVWAFGPFGAQHACAPMPRSILTLHGVPAHVVLAGLD